MDGWLDEWMGRWVDGGWMDEWMHGWMDGMDGRMEGCVNG